jgi:hypothetical protein
MMPEWLASPVGRRAFLGRSVAGIGALGLASLAAPRALPGQDELPPGRHRPARAKRVIWLYMAGGPSHLETFDPKPELGRRNGEPFPESLTRGQPIAQLQGARLTCMGPQFPFLRAGRSGQQVSSLFPHVAAVADKICIVRSMVTEQINHDPAHTFMNSGTSISGRPSMGSWLWYGLGSESQNLPAFVVFVSTGKGRPPQPVATRQWSSGFLPSRFQGVQFRTPGEPIHYLGRPPGISEGRQRDVVDAVRALNRIQNDAVDDPEIGTRIAQYEMAFRLQTSVPALLDLSDEREETLRLYGVKGLDGSFATNCLLARRLAERGVRFIQLYHRDWDFHDGLRGYMQVKAEETDQAAAALLVDLEQRGLLDETIVVWGGEFGRTPMGQGTGRDHHIKGFSIWLAGGGIRGGVTYGATDDFGYNAVEDIVHVHDLHATLLHLLGVDHTRLTYKFQGRDFRLTDVHGHVVRQILA